MVANKRARILSFLGLLGLILTWLSVLFVFVVHLGGLTQEPWASLHYFPPAVLVLPLTAGLGFTLASRRHYLTMAGLMILGSVLTFLMRPIWSDSSGGVRSLRIVSLNAQSYSSNLQKVSVGLKALDPDILILQEVWLPSHLEVLEEEFPQFEFRGDRIWRGGDGLFVGTRLDSQPGLRPRPRHAATAIAELGGVESLVVSLHGTKVHGFSWHSLRETIKLQSAQLETLETLVQGYRGRLLVVGDFNSPAEGVFRALESFGLRDAFSEVGRGYGYTFPSVLPLVRLDRVYYSPELLVPLGVEVVDVGSDHRAVVADFKFK